MSDGGFSPPGTRWRSSGVWPGDLDGPRRLRPRRTVEAVVRGYVENDLVIYASAIFDGGHPGCRSPLRRRPQLSIHKTTEVQDWLTEHPRWQLVFTSKHASWLNQVEIFFSILTRRLLRHGQFSDPDDLATQMLAFVEHYNLTSQPFAWTYTGKVLAA